VHPIDILTTAADIVAAHGAKATPGRWAVVDLTENGYPGVWWVRFEHSDQDGTMSGTVAELETHNGAADAVWIATMAPDIVAPLLVDAFHRAAEVIAWSRYSEEPVAEFSLLTFARCLIAGAGQLA
jgi:hypothetical protein